MSIRFEYEWTDSGPSRDELARRTMATLRIHVDGAPVTSVVDHRTRTYRDHVIVPLYQLADWLVAHWHHLFHEIEDTAGQQPEFEARHNLAFAGDGFVLPDLTISPISGQMNLRWVQYQPQFTSLQFVGSGEARVAAPALQAQVQTLVEAVLSKLRDENLDDCGLAEAWDGITSLQPEEREFAHAAALLGVDPFDVEDAVEDALVRFWQVTEPSLREDALAGASPESLPRVQEWLRRGLEILEQESASRQDDWLAVRRALPGLRSETAWAQGYELARLLRDQLSANDVAAVSESDDVISVPHYEVPSPTSTLQGLVAARTPACVTTPRSIAGKRFLLARAVGEFLSRSPAGASILSSLATDAQARSRAFAAEFLAPAERLREMLGSGPVEPEMVDDLSGAFRVSSQVIRHQIENHGLARFAQS